MKKVAECKLAKTQEIFGRYNSNKFEHLSVWSKDPNIQISDCREVNLSLERNVVYFTVVLVPPRLGIMAF